MSGTPTCRDAARPQRLAAQLADMIPGAATIRVSFTDPTQRWPYTYSRALDAAGEPIELSRITAKIAARWILRVWPEADWSLAHTLFLATATLTRGSARAATGRGR
ncbi:transcriptional regulator [Kitasatospora sp. NPDC056138]|uniref:transcriptional regulator n=1 Tax=Kitasatospora sp. NPDC056138 TaxID=3345724 RepID=UPI0035DC24D1